MRVRVLENPKRPDGFSIFFPYNPKDVDTIKLCLGTVWDKTLKCWTTEGPEVLLDMQRFGVEVERMSEGARKVAESFRQQLWDTMDCRLLDLDGSEYAYQQQGTDFLAAMPRAILADDMGTGKSKQSLDAAAKVNAQQILVLCNKTLIYNWINEVEKWHPEWTVDVVPSLAKTTRRNPRNPAGGPGRIGRDTFWLNQPNVTIANYEMLSQRDWPAEIDWDVVIMDEASRFKNANTIVYKNVRKVAKYATYAWALTGTPLEKNITEMYNLFALLRPTVLGNYMRFKDQHLDTGRWSTDVHGLRNLPLLHERIAPFILRRTKGEVLKQLPPKIFQNNFVKLSVEEQKAYDSMTLKFNNSLTEWRVSGDDNPMTQMLRMRQFCCTPTLFTEELGRGSKYEALVELIESWPGKILVFCYFTEVIDKLREWLDVDPRAYITGPVNAKERDQRIRDFNNGLLGKVFLSSDAGNQGLNITGANMIVHYDRIYNAQKMNQREDRLHRIGQTDNVTVVNLMCLDSIDYGIYQLNKEEEDLFKTVVDGAEELLIRKLDAPRLRRLVEGKLEVA